MNPWYVVVAAVLIFGCAAYLGVQAGRWAIAEIEPFDDGPAPGTPRPIPLIAGAALIGGLMAFGGSNPHALLAAPRLDLLQLLLYAVLAFALVACWYADVATGIVPDLFSLGALGLTALVAVASNDHAHLFSLVIIAVPFALAALFSRGTGMGWGDVKLVALGGATIGLLSALLAFAGACLVAVIVAFARGKRHEPVAFAPYLIASIAFVLAFPGLLP